MENIKDLRVDDLMYFIGDDGDIIMTVKVHGINPENESAEVDLGGGVYVDVPAGALKPIPANKPDIWEQNGFLELAKVSGGNTIAYIELIGPKVSPVPVTEPKTVMVVLGNILTYIVFNDKANPNIPSGRQHLSPYTYLHEIQHLYQDYGYLKNWKYSYTKE